MSPSTFSTFSVIVPIGSVTKSSILPIMVELGGKPTGIPGIKTRRLSGSSIPAIPPVAGFIVVVTPYPPLRISQISPEGKGIPAASSTPLIASPHSCGSLGRTSLILDQRSSQVGNSSCTCSTASSRVGKGSLSVGSGSGSGSSGPPRSTPGMPVGSTA